MLSRQHRHFLMPFLRQRHTHTNPTRAKHATPTQCNPPRRPQPIKELHPIAAKITTSSTNNHGQRNTEIESEVATSYLLRPREAADIRRLSGAW